MVSGSTLAKSGHIHACPKVLLDDHLATGIRLETLIELSEEDGYDLPETDLDKLASWFERKSNSNRLEDQTDCVVVVASATQTTDSIYRVAYESVIDLGADNVVYAEIRVAPELHAHRDGLAYDAVIEAALGGIAAGRDESERAGKPITVGVLVGSSRHSMNSMETAELAVRHRSHGVVGYDLMGPDVQDYPLRWHGDTFDYLANHAMPYTIHAGEVSGLESVAMAVRRFETTRIVGGMALIEDIVRKRREYRLGSLAGLVRDRGVALEMSPTRNVQTGTVWSLQDHPMYDLMGAGLNITVNTKHRILLGRTMSQMLTEVASAGSLTMQDVYELTMNAATSAFLAPDERAELISGPIEQYWLDALDNS